jgi:hypothetical protein
MIRDRLTTTVACARIRSLQVREDTLVSKQALELIDVMKASLPDPCDENYKHEFDTYVLRWLINIEARLSPKSKHFEEFWSLYPRKVSKSMALKAFLSMRGDDNWPAIKVNIEERLLKKNWETTADRLQYVPHPSTYLRGQRWLDVIEDRRKDSDKGQWFERRTP